MNKLAQYLNQHLVGEVTTDPIILKKYQTDGSPLNYAPQMVAVARSVSDIRKLLRFTWQLAEKGHQLPLTVRGSGMGTQGGALGTGVILSLRENINTIFEYDPKQRLLRLQPGAMAASVQSALGLYGDSITALDDMSPDATLGGWVSEEAISYDSVRELEVVLANGDLLHTRRLSKREFNKKKGEQSFEADIYRGIDALLEDQAAVIEKVNFLDGAGFGALTMVKDKDGSFDLTPLFVGSQGALGVISEMILATAPAQEDRIVVLASFEAVSDARDALDEIDKIGATKIEIINRSTLERARSAGKVLPVVNEQTEVLVAITLADGASRAQTRKAKRLRSVCEQHGATVSAEDETIYESSLKSFVQVARQANDSEGELVTIASGAHVPLVRFEEFMQAIDELSKKRRVPLLVTGMPLDGKWTIQAHLKLGTVSGKQLVFKLIEDCAEKIAALDGVLVCDTSEGRMASFSAYSRLDADVLALFDEVKKIFDPHGTLNAGVKQKSTIKDLAQHLSSQS